MPGIVGINRLGTGLLSTTPSTPAWPLKQSAGKRYLVDQGGNPFLFCGDSPWELFTALSTSDMSLYLKDRKARGFTSLLIEAIDNVFSANATTGNINGDLPFTTKQGGGAYTNSQTQSPDFSTPNEVYWKQVDVGMALVLAYGFQVQFYPIWLGNPIGDPTTEGYYNALNAQSAGTRQGYGAFIGARYRSYPNLIWVVGGDNNPANTAVVTDIVTGIQSVDTSHLFSFDGLDGTDPLTTTLGWTPSATFVQNGSNNIYTDEFIGHPWTYVDAAAKVAASTCPFFQKEGKYEDTDNQHLLVRSQTWQSMLGGACGYHFGNTPLWLFGAGWQGTLGLRGSLDTQVANLFFSARRWDLLASDPTHTFLTNGGSYSNATFASAARATDGTWGAIYVPTNESLIVDLSGFAFGVTASWLDPTTGVQTGAGSFSNSGTHTFASTPGSNAQGDGDWVLVFVKT